jgi:predicted lysophospholipase L1 biosynthesis ABC-type transport system permease subunit
MSYKTRATGTLVVAFIFLAIAISILLYGQGKDQYIDAILVAIGALIFFMLSLHIFRQGRKRKL